MKLLIKWYLMPSYLTYKVWIKVKGINPGKGEAPSPTPWCTS